MFRIYLHSYRKIWLGFLSLLFYNDGYSWGFASHSLINKIAVETLPTPLLNFFLPYQSYLAEHAVDPDKRRYIDTLEAARHYIDLEYYESQLPLDTVPHFWKSALEKYGQKHMRDFGSLPWQIQLAMWKLRTAFSEKNIEKILQSAAELGHYVADAHVPLHTTANYDGQLTQQRGIHALWETKIPDLSVETYLLSVPKANFWFSESDTIFKIIEESHELIGMILRAHKTINGQIPEQYRYAIKVTPTTGKPFKDLSNSYLLSCEKAMENSISNRLRMSIYRVASCWYTCWILAGQPHLPIKSSRKPWILTKGKHPTVKNPSTPPLNTFGLLQYHPQNTIHAVKGIPLDTLYSDSSHSHEIHTESCRK